MLTIYKASAGSGKTFSLALEYIKILLGIRRRDGSYALNDDAHTPSGHRTPDRHRAILAITFTNAATEEMKTRIIRELDALAHIADTPLADETLFAQKLVAEYGCSRPSLRAAAATALNELLNDYGSFNVSTIDSFFQTVLRTFSREIDHQGDYELSMDRKDAIRQSVSQMLDQLNYHALPASQRLYGWIRSFMLDRMASGSNYNFFNRSGGILATLAKRMDSALNEKYVEHSAQMRRFMENPTRVDDYLKALRSLADAQIAAVRPLAVAFGSLCADLGLSFDDIRYHTKNLNNMSATPPEISSKTFGGTDAKAFIKDGTPFPNRITQTTQKKLGLSDGDLLSVAEALTELYGNAWKAFCRAAVFNRMADSFVETEFMIMAERNMEEFMRRENTMLISDAGELLTRIISDAEMPFIYERLGMQLENLLIDEFQDTSRMQWHNLKPLVSNSLADSHDNLIIGDVKQAIYRFRNSDSSLLDTVVPDQDFPDHNPRGSHPDDNTNRRSAPEIVRFNNTLFSLVGRRYKFSSYNGVVQNVDPRILKKKIDGYVTVTVFEEQPSDDMVLGLMADRIRSQHEAGYRWRDILILVRATEQGNKTVTHFLENYPDIPILSNESLLLRNSPAVRTIMSMLALVEKVYASSAERADVDDDGKPRYGTHDDIVDFENRYHFFVNQGLPPEDALAMALENNDADTGTLREQIHAIRAENPASLVALIEGIISHKLSDQERIAQQPYIAALQDRAIKHSISSDPSVSAFVGAYNRNSGVWAIVAPSDLDAVQVMTIHKSKGLERDCVHIPFGDWALAKETEIWLPLDKLTAIAPDDKPPMARISLGLNDALLDPDICPEFADYAAAERNADVLDNINVSYVAYTRACRELNVYSDKKNFGADLRELLQTSGTAGENTVDLAANVGASTVSWLAPDAQDPEEVESVEALCYELGQPTAPTAPKPADPVCPPPPYFVVHREDSRELISVDDVFSEKILTGDEAGSEVTDTPDGTPRMRIAARRGNNMHSILENMATLDDLDASIGAHLNRGFIRPSEAEEYRTLLREAFDNASDLVKAWFSPDCEVFAERSIYDPAANETYRPDRVVRLPDGTLTVIDFKFTTTRRRAHTFQVANYRRLLAEIDGTEVQAFLWYPLLDGTPVKV
mgnify:CR=1 FL=1